MQGRHGNGCNLLQLEIIYWLISSHSPGMNLHFLFLHFPAHGAVGASGLTMLYNMYNRLMGFEA